jgi:hypothetical protein
MYVINPDLTKIDIAFTRANVSGFGGSTGTGNPNPASGNCKSDSMLSKIKSVSQGQMDPCLTFALLNTESSCTVNVTSGAGACGITQLLPSTAGVSCDMLNSDIDLALSKGISYFLSNSGIIRGSLSGSGNSFNQAVEDLYAAYNGGAGALAASSNCTTGTNRFGFPYKKWDCNINPGGYVETQTAAPRFLNSYNTCKSDSNIQSKLN